MEPQNKRPSYTQDVTNKVLALMEGEGLKPWEASWDRGLTKAFNPYTREKGRQGREYRGANALNLLLAQLQRDSADPRWLTFNDHGRAVCCAGAGTSRCAAQPGRSHAHPPR